MVGQSVVRRTILKIGEQFMYRDGNRHEPLTGYSEGQLWLYRLMRQLYQESGPDCAVPAAEIAGLMEWGAAAARGTDQAFWRDGVRAAASLPSDWYEREEAAEQYFTRLGLVPVQAVIESHTAANN